MLDTTLLASVATQLLTRDDVDVDGKRLRVRRTSSRRLRVVNFSVSRLLRLNRMFPHQRPDLV